MDLWIIAAAAGAGYAAKANYLKNFPAKLTDSSQESHALDCGHGKQNSWNSLYKLRHKYCPMCRLETLEESNGKSELSHKSNESVAETRQKASTSRRLITGGQLYRSSNDYIQKALFSRESFVTAEMSRIKTRLEECENELLTLPRTAMAMPLTEDFPQEVETETKPPLPTRPPKKTTLSSASPHKEGSLNGLLMFLLGATVAATCFVGANKREVDGLNNMLKLNMKLVQDLHDELEMEDLAVTEIANEVITMQERPEQSSGHATPPMFLNKQERDESTNKGTAANSEAMREIEAELEAELVRLELSLKPTFLQENDQEEMTDEKPATASDSDCDIDESYFGVSPKKLTLRLHEVIQSRLEARITELEAALENSQRRLIALQSACNFPDQDFSDEAEISLDQEGERQR